MKKLFSTIIISALLCVNTFATPVVVNSEPATFEKPVIIRQSTSFLSLREIASNLLDNVNLQWNAENLLLPVRGTEAAAPGKRTEIIQMEEQCRMIFGVAPFW